MNKSLLDTDFDITDSELSLSCIINQKFHRGDSEDVCLHTFFYFDEEVGKKVLQNLTNLIESEAISIQEQEAQKRLDVYDNLIIVDWTENEGKAKTVGISFLINGNTYMFGTDVVEVDCDSLFIQQLHANTSRIKSVFFSIPCTWSKIIRSKFLL